MEERGRGREGGEREREGRRREGERGRREGMEEREDRWRREGVGEMEERGRGRETGSVTVRPIWQHTHPHAYPHMHTPVVNTGHAHTCSEHRPRGNLLHVLEEL